LEEYEKFWAEWRARPETPKVLEQLRELVERGGGNEIWTLAGQRS
jgi:hypothetical protein